MFEEMPRQRNRIAQAQTKLQADSCSMLFSISETKHLRWELLGSDQLRQAKLFNFPFCSDLQLQNGCAYGA